MITPNKHLTNLRTLFRAKGYDLWFVGGCVRDSINGEKPKDIDLCTDATPAEAITIYKENQIKFFETGLDHGTLTVRRGGESYEITTLRTESEHDGRRAVVQYTRDLNEDLSRRDLTINAMAQDFDGEIIDPFGGREDLANKRVRMVGNAEERFKEDYLRILRFFRFHARFAGLNHIDDEAREAIIKTNSMLKEISGERIWQEMKKIIVGPNSSLTLHRMKNIGTLYHIRIRQIDTVTALQCELKKLNRPATVLGMTMGADGLEETLSRWRMSNNERAEARFAKHNSNVRDIDAYKRFLVDGKDIEWVEQLTKFYDLPSLADWDVPVFPVNGLDLINTKGIESGPAIGVALRGMRQRWIESNYSLNKKQLLG